MISIMQSYKTTSENVFYRSLSSFIEVMQVDFQVSCKSICYDFVM